MTIRPSWFNTLNIWQALTVSTASSSTPRCLRKALVSSGTLWILAPHPKTKISGTGPTRSSTERESGVRSSIEDRFQEAN